MSGIRLRPTYKHPDDRWPMLISVDYEDGNTVRWYAPDGGTDIGVTRPGAKEELIRKMYEHLLLYESKLHEAGYTFVPNDWARFMTETGCGPSE